MPGKAPTAAAGPRRLPSLRSLLISALSLAALLVVAEAATRAWLLAPAAPRVWTEYGWVEAPGSRTVFSREGYSITHRNSWGFDDEEPDPGPVRIRALLVGDSYAQAHQVPREEAFPERTEALVPGLDIVNTGRSGLTPAHYAVYLPALTRTFSPDVIVLQVNDGDVGTLAASPLLGSGDLEADLTRFERREARRHREEGVRAAARWLTRRSALANLVANRLTLLAARERRRLESKLGPGEAHASAPEPGERLPSGVAGLMDGLLAASGADPARTVLLYIPNLVYSSDGCANKWPQRRRFWIEFAERNRLRLVDASDALCEVYAATGQPAHGFHNSIMGTGHINARGHEAVARLLAGAVEELAP